MMLPGRWSILIFPFTIAFDISLSGVSGGDPPVTKPLPPISPPSKPVSPSSTPDNKLAQDLLDFAKWRHGEAPTPEPRA